MPAKIIQRNKKPMKKVKVDSVTIDIIESALRNARYEMDTVLFRTAMSPGIREQHDEFPMIANLEGKMVVGQFGSFIWGFMQGYDGTVEEGDVFLTNDPYSVNGAISHQNDWLMLMPIYKDGRIIAWSAMFGHMTDVGGKVPGSLPTDARTDLRGRRLAFRRSRSSRPGVLQDDLLKVILHNCRLPTWNFSDFNAIVAALRTAAIRCVEISTRFGDDVFYSAMDAMLERNKRAMRAADPPDGPGEEAVLRGLHLRRRPEHGAVQDRVHDVARRATSASSTSRAPTRSRSPRSTSC